MALLAREAKGRDAGTFDAFGGGRETNEKHPVETAAREFAEEIIYTGDNRAIRLHIDVDGHNTSAIVANQNKSFVVYVTAFDKNMLKSLTHSFYHRRAAAKSYKNKEKDMLAWVPCGIS